MRHAQANDLGCEYRRVLFSQLKVWRMALRYNNLRLKKHASGDPMRYSVTKGLTKLVLSRKTRVLVSNQLPP